MRFYILSFAILISALLPATMVCSQVPDRAQKVDTGINTQQTFWKKLPPSTGWINDFEELFTPQQEKVLDSLVTAFEKETTIEIAVVTLDTTATEKERFDELILHIHNTWGVGKKETNNGIVIGISAGYRTLRISNGYGIEKLWSNAETKQLIDADFVPFFKQGAYYQGVENGLKALMAALRQKIKAPNN